MNDALREQLAYDLWEKLDEPELREEFVNAMMEKYNGNPTLFANDWEGVYGDEPPPVRRQMLTRVSLLINSLNVPGDTSEEAEAYARENVTDGHALTMAIGSDIMNMMKIESVWFSKGSGALSNGQLTLLNSLVSGLLADTIDLSDLQMLIDPDALTPTWWQVSDFECKASEIENSRKCTLFDRSKFREALQQMITRHDASIGITWDLIGDYLWEVCALPKDQIVPLEEEDGT